MVRMLGKDVMLMLKMLKVCVSVLVDECVFMLVVLDVSVACEKAFKAIRGDDVTYF